ncbi:tetratricopeptide repeat protein [Nocardiopsis kunsanensis]|uniref:Tetratricopeptide repeat protein n=1 Tax=Nocardiopsis kunsanensis TaxID=141693 RepID=A0A918XGN9_9ACTN|nr:hypothetical protein [Nocardiopsis kunsanensis]GHD30915.1 hypothetical protein GCM10007147_33140 [Nocardiopsis kunsanensis]
MDSVQRAEALTDFAVAGPEDAERFHAAVEHARERVAGLGARDPDRAFALFALGTGLRALFSANEEPAILEEAVTTLRRAVRACEREDPDLPQYLTEFVVALCHRVEGGKADVIDEALTHARRAVELTSATHPQYPSRLTLLAGVLRFRATTGSTAPDRQALDEALMLHRQALEGAVDADPVYARYLRAYAQTLLVQARAEGDHTIAHEAEHTCYTAMRRAHPYDPLPGLLLATAQEAQAVRGALM